MARLRCFHSLNGTYFNYDVGSDYKTDIMAEQLAGQWYANLTGLGEIVPAEMRRSALQHVFDFNVMKSQNGAIGAVNGIAASAFSQVEPFSPRRHGGRRNMTTKATKYRKGEEGTLCGPLCPLWFHPGRSPCLRVSVVNRPSPGSTAALVNIS